MLISVCPQLLEKGQDSSSLVYSKRKLKVDFSGAACTMQEWNWIFWSQKPEFVINNLLSEVAAWVNYRMVSPSKDKI